MEEMMIDSSFDSILNSSSPHFSLSPHHEAISSFFWDVTKPNGRFTAEWLDCRHHDWTQEPFNSHFSPVFPSDIFLCSFRHEEENSRERRSLTGEKEMKEKKQFYPSSSFSIRSTRGHHFFKDSAALKQEIVIRYLYFSCSSSSRISKKPDQESWLSCIWNINWRETSLHRGWRSSSLSSFPSSDSTWSSSSWWRCQYPLVWRSSIRFIPRESFCDKCLHGNFRCQMDFYGPLTLFFTSPPPVSFFLTSSSSYPQSPSHPCLFLFPVFHPPSLPSSSPNLLLFELLFITVLDLSPLPTISGSNPDIIFWFAVISFLCYFLSFFTLGFLLMITNSTEWLTNDFNSSQSFREQLYCNRSTKITVKKREGENHHNSSSDLIASSVAVIFPHLDSFAWNWPDKTQVKRKRGYNCYWWLYSPPEFAEAYYDMKRKKWSSSLWLCCDISSDGNKQ